MDRAYHGAAGPEWAYCRCLAKSVVKARLDQLYISVYSQDEVVPKAFDVLEIVKKGPEAAAQSPVLQYDFNKLETQLTGPRGLAPYGLWFEAYAGAGSVEIPDAQSFRRLLLAITYLGGIPVPYAGDDPSMTYPPLLRFLAKPKGSPEGRPVSESNLSSGHRHPADDPNVPSLPRDIAGRDARPPSPPPQRFRQRPPEPQPPHREDSHQDALLRTPQRDSPPQEAPNTVLPQLVVPLEEPEFEDRVEQVFGEGLNRRRSGHDERFHNLYAQIAGIETNRRDNDGGLGNIFVVANTNCLTDTALALGKGEVQQLYHQPSIIVWDEMHETKSLDHNAMVVIKGLMTLAEKPVHVVAMSGTPISNGPEDFNLAEDLAIHKKMGEWYGEDTLARYKHDLDLHSKDFIDLAKEVRIDDNINLAKEGRQLTDDDKREAHNLLRRYDEACHRYTDVLPLLQRGSTGDYLGYPLPAYSTTYNRKPRIHRFNTPMDIFSSAVTTQRDAVRSSEYWDMVPNAFCQRPGSGLLQPKVARICEIIDEMLQDRERHESLPKNAAPLRKKAVICVPHAWQGFILITFLFKKYRNHNFTFVGAGMSAVLRSKLMAPFSRKTNKVHMEDSQEDDPIALISTISFIGSGLNLIRCNYCIATSPPEESRRRVTVTCTTHNYVLLDDGNPVDVVTFHRMQTRTALTVPLDDRKDGYNFILGANDDAEEEDPSNVMDVDEMRNEDIDNGEADDGSQDVDNDEDDER
ncbi:hypothetical protein INS49_011493 [Diaporthe citri]|uniref:uncharacterized protein n=1 Tax=Diaporthe citri TaxID=83186 RepID=UPI001C810C36|nr:uncharacterized protein INS49_011493 [Diaporthe citri]KAG6360433.1 hypothetical protein INS49_011493 [Diaporthe citri]